jgi:hypothetical protein
MHNETLKSIGELQLAVNKLDAAFVRHNTARARDRNEASAYVAFAEAVGRVQGCMRALQTAIAIYDPPEPLYANEKMQDAAVRRMDEGQ